MTLLRFLSDLAADPSKQLAFHSDPAGFARRHGMDESLIPTLASRDSTKLRELLSSEAARAMVYSPETAAVYSPETAAIYSPQARAWPH
jgi:hypothetical protein